MNVSPDYRVDSATPGQIVAHLRQCDADFCPPLSSRVDLQSYADKLARHAVRLEAWIEQDLAGFVALYCDKQAGDTAYISNVSVCRPWRGLGIARTLVAQAIAHARSAGMREIGLEVNAGHSPAVALYAGLGFMTEDAGAAPVHMKLVLQPGKDDESGT